MGIEMQPDFVNTRQIANIWFMAFRRLLVFWVLILCSVSLAWSQDDDPIRVDSSLVRLNVGVVDMKGRPITSLNKGNFELFEDGVRQEI